jgi:hypothetical protein
MLSRRIAFGTAALLFVAVRLSAAPIISVPPPGPTPSLEIRIAPGPPPTPKKEIIILEHRQGPDSIWIDGTWEWNPRGWVWYPGRWIVPPAPNARWISPRYVRLRQGWRYEPPHWSTQKLIDRQGIAKQQNTAPKK